MTIRYRFSGGRLVTAKEDDPEVTQARWALRGQGFPYSFHDLETASWAILGGDDPYLMRAGLREGLGIIGEVLEDDCDPDEELEQ